MRSHGGRSFVIGGGQMVTHGGWQAAQKKAKKQEIRNCTCWDGGHLGQDGRLWRNRVASGCVHRRLRASLSCSYASTEAGVSSCNKFRTEIITSSGNFAASSMFPEKKKQMCGLELA